MIADDIMTRRPITVTERDSIGDALKLLVEEDVRHLPVVRGTDVVGMLSDRDFRGLGISLVQDLETYDKLRGRLGRPVSTLMSGGVVTVGRDADVTEIVELMLEEKLSAVAVVETGTTELAGVISYMDILEAALPMLAAE